MTNQIWHKFYTQKFLKNTWQTDLFYDIIKGEVFFFFFFLILYLTLRSSYGIIKDLGGWGGRGEHMFFCWRSPIILYHICAQKSTPDRAKAQLQLLPTRPEALSPAGVGEHLFALHLLDDRLTLTLHPNKRSVYTTKKNGIARVNCYTYEKNNKLLLNGRYKLL